MRWFGRVVLLIVLIGILGWVFGKSGFLGFLLSVLLVVVLQFLQRILVASGVAALFRSNVNDLRGLEAQLSAHALLIGKRLRRNAAAALGKGVQQGVARTATILANAVTRNDDPHIRRIATDFLAQLTTQPQIDEAASVWVETRHSVLTELLVTRRWIASSPVKTHVLSALKTDSIEQLQQGAVEIVEPLIDATGDGDVEIAARARQILPLLQRDDAKDALCRFVIHHEHPAAMDAALTSGYLPRDASQRAIFLFLTEQWERYEALDFDRSLLNAAQKNASTDLRRRIADRLRKSGRIEYLTIIAGADFRSQAADMTTAETDVLVNMLTARSEWDKLWKLAFDLPFVWSIRIVNKLREMAWQPSLTDERLLFSELRAVTDREMITSEDAARRVLPLTVHEATIKVRGRVNDVAFSPVRPVIAIGAGNRHVGVWNFQHAAMEEIWKGFDHSIGLVTFAPDGMLLCAERTNAVAEACAMYACRKNEMVKFGQHEGSVTALDMIDATRIFSSGRDQKICLWDIANGELIQEQHQTFWARAAAVSPDGNYAIVLHEGVTLIALPTLNEVTSWSKGHVGRCAAFISGETTVVVGKSSGDVHVYDYAQNARKEREELQPHDQRVQGVIVRPTTSTVITAGSEGKLHFTDWKQRTFLGSVELPDAHFTSLRMSPDGAFMATGDSDASMSLWDLRVLDVPHLFTRPFAQASPDHLVAVSDLAANAKLPAAIRHSLTFMQRILQYRFRFDIEIDDVPAIKIGEFDIEIE